uniref:Uncharacterized protein n=1 Tax=Arundo donax TaxID=35708 RepID=A0A0A9A298_ARUDO
MLLGFFCNNPVSSLCITNDMRYLLDLISTTNIGGIMKQILLPTTTNIGGILSFLRWWYWRGPHRRSMIYTIVSNVTKYLFQMIFILKTLFLEFAASWNILLVQKDHINNTHIVRTQQY